MASFTSAITGGYVYRGKKIPSLVGWYVYGDYAKGQLWALKYENGKVTGDELLLQRSNWQISSFGQDLDGELYICDHGWICVSREKDPIAGWLVRLRGLRQGTALGPEIRKRQS